MGGASTTRRRVEQVTLQAGEEPRRRSRRDLLATEEPLEIRVVPADGGATRPVAVTMRTPGADFELAAGFLFGERLVESASEIAAIRYCADGGAAGLTRPAAAADADPLNVVNVFLTADSSFDPRALSRNFYTTSSCGVCGKASIESVRALLPSAMDTRDPAAAGELRVTAETLLSLPGRLREAQSVFERTGGLHAAASFTAEGELIRLREDVGRHNAMDKLVGAALLAGELPLAAGLLLVSGRLSFELVQKAGRAGVHLLAGVSAPSSLAAELADELGITLVGFLRDARFNVYAHGERVVTHATPAVARG